MKLEKKYLAKILLLFLSTLLFFGFANNSGDKNKTQKIEKVSNTTGAGVESYFFKVNKLDMPIDSKGITADVEIPGHLTQGRIDGINFLYSGGFMISGINDQGIMWSSGVASASSVNDYEAGNAMLDPDDATNTVADDTYAGLYVVNVLDEPFGESWINWIEAVDAGANFYDGDGDGIYNPVDLNGNGIWDEDEDSPDILGTEVAWCVYTDSQPSQNRTYNDVDPQGIEIRQSVWAYATDNDLGNIIFIRYSLLNTGLLSDVQDSVYFGVWADPDLGTFSDDLVGSDTSLNAGFVYNDGPDDTFGVDPPCFLIDFFQGPWEATGNPLDFALNTGGPLRGVDTIWGHKNVPLTSFVQYIQGHPTQGDPNDEIEARAYLNGFNQQGEVIDPCDWAFGVVYGMDCSTVDPRYMYSGDPVSLEGWIHAGPDDQRQMSNSGPFTLYKDQPVDVVVAYVAGRSKSAIASVKETKKIDRSAQFVFQNNFIYPSPPPAIEPIVKANGNSIELIWETYSQMEYSDKGKGYDMHFEYYEVKMYNSYATGDENAGRNNAAIIARYDVQNDIGALLVEDAVTSERELVYDVGGIQLDSATYFDKNTGRISLIITQDPFTGGPLVKNKPYFISISGTAVNYDEIEKFDALGTYLVPATAVVGYLGNISTIIDDEYGNQGIITGEVQNEPYYAGILAEHVAGFAETDVSYSVQDKEKTTSHTYEVGFFEDSLKIPYELFYYVMDKNTGVKLIDSSKKFLFDGTDFDNNTFDPAVYYSDQINNIIDGVSVTIPWVSPGIGSTEFVGTDWINPVDDSLTGAFYVGRDIAQPIVWLPITSKATNAVTVGDLKRVELRFGATSKAFRYVQDPNRFVWNGKVNSDLDSGFVDVPFQAWVKTDTEEYQLATGYTESKTSIDTLGNLVGMPDAKYYPGNDVELSLEYIVIFNAPYSDDVNDNLIYSDNLKVGSGDLGNGMRRPNAIFNDSLKAIGKSPWFNTLYVCGFETNQPRDSFSPTGTFVINPGVYLTNQDKYEYVAETELTDADDKSNWDKVNVFPNPLFAINEGVSYTGGNFDQPYVTFNNLPLEVTIKLYSLSGVLVRTLNKSDASSILRWDLENEDDLRVASGMYIALISNPKFGDKVLKFAIIMPQKQIQNY